MWIAARPTCGLGFVKAGSKRAKPCKKGKKYIVSLHSVGLQPKSDGLQPKSDGLQPNSMDRWRGSLRILRVEGQSHGALSALHRAPCQPLANRLPTACQPLANRLPSDNWDLRVCQRPVSLVFVCLRKLSGPPTSHGTPKSALYSVLKKRLLTRRQAFPNFSCFWKRLIYFT